MRARITDLALNGSGIRDTARVLGISTQAVMAELKKNRRLSQRPPVWPDYVAGPDAGLRLCADEMWSFVGCKLQPRWLWWVEEADTGRVLAFVFGRRKP